MAEKTKANKKSTDSFSKKEIKDGKIMAILSYFGVLALIPYFCEKKNKYIQAHAKIGMNLFILEAIVAVASSVIPAILTLTIIFIPLAILVAILTGMIGIFFFVVSIVGIINAINDEVKPLPLIGKLQFIK